jgi:hypothetical protein
MNPYYEKIAQIQHTLPMDGVEVFFLFVAALSAAVLLFTLGIAIKAEIEYQQRSRGWSMKEWIIRAFGLAYIKRWLQDTFFLFTDDKWEEAQRVWLKERQERKKGAPVKDTWIKERLDEEKKSLMESTKAVMKTKKAMAKYECGICGHEDRTEMNLYAEISEAAKTLCYKELCQKCKNRKLKIVMIECKLFERKK